MSEKLATAYVEFASNAEPYMRGIGQMKSEVGQQLSAVSAMVGAGLTAVGTAISAMGHMSLNSFAKFEGGMREVFTLLPQFTEDQKRKMIADVEDLAVAMNILPETIVPALYQAISAGVPPDNVFSFLATAQKAAKGGVTDLQTSVDGLTSVVNAYAASLKITVEEASDMMFTAVRLGKTNFPQLSRYIYQAVPAAAAARVGFDEVAAAMALITSVGTPTRVTANMVGAAIDELAKGNMVAAKNFKHITGKSFTDFTRGGGTLTQALKIMSTHAKKTGLTVKDMFSSIEAGTAAQLLIETNAERFTDFLGQMRDASGATDAAFKEMRQGVLAVRGAIAAAGAVLKLEFGAAMAKTVVPILQHLATALKAGVQWFRGLSEATRTNIVEGAMLVAHVVALGGAIYTLNRTAKLFGTTLVRMFTIGTGIGAIVVGFVAIAMAIKAAVEWLWKQSAIQTAIHANMYRLTQAWENFKSAAMTAWEAIKGAFINAATAVFKLFGINLETLGDDITAWVAAGIEAVSRWALEASEWLRVFVEHAGTVWELMTTSFLLGLSRMRDAFWTFASNLPVFFRAAYAALAAGAAQWFVDQSNRIQGMIELLILFAKWVGKDFGNLLYRSAKEAFKKVWELMQWFGSKLMEWFNAIREMRFDAAKETAKAMMDQLKNPEATDTRGTQNRIKALLEEQATIASGLNVARAMATAFADVLKDELDPYVSDATRELEARERRLAGELVDAKRDLERQRTGTLPRMQPREGPILLTGGMRGPLRGEQAATGAGKIEAGYTSFADLQRKIQEQMLKGTADSDNLAMIAQSTELGRVAAEKTAQNTEEIKNQPKGLG